MKVDFGGNYLTITGHAENKEKCAAVSALCHALSNTSGVDTVDLQRGYVSFKWDDNVDVSGIINALQELETDPLDLFAMLGYRTSVRLSDGSKVVSSQISSSPPTFNEMTLYLLENGISDIVRYRCYTDDGFVEYTDLYASDEFPYYTDGSDYFAITIYVIRQTDLYTTYNVYSPSGSSLITSHKVYNDGSTLSVKSILSELSLSGYYGEKFTDSSNVVYNASSALSYQDGVDSVDLYLVESQYRSYPHLLQDFADAYRAVSETTNKIQLSDLPGLIGGLTAYGGKIYFSDAEPTASDGNNFDIWIKI